MNEIVFEIEVKRSINLFENDELYCDFQTGYYDKNLMPLLFEKGADVSIVKTEMEKVINYKVRIIDKKNFKLKEIITEKILGTNKIN